MVVLESAEVEYRRGPHCARALGRWNTLEQLWPAAASWRNRAIAAAVCVLRRGRPAAPRMASERCAERGAAGMARHRYPIEATKTASHEIRRTDRQETRRNLHADSAVRRRRLGNRRVRHSSAPGWLLCSQPLGDVLALSAARAAGRRHPVLETHLHNASSREPRGIRRRFRCFGDIPEPGRTLSCAEVRMDR